MTIKKKICILSGFFLIILGIITLLPEAMKNRIFLSSSVTNIITASSTTESLSYTTIVPSTTDNPTSTLEISSTTTFEPTTTEPQDTTSIATTEIPTTSEVPISSDIPYSTLPSTTSEEVSTTEIYISSTTETPTSTLPESTSETPSSTEGTTTDTVPPSIINITSTHPDGTYGIGVKIPLIVEFSETVIVTGIPTITLATGTNKTKALYISGSGSNKLLFEYIVAAGDNSPDLNYFSRSSLAVPIGSKIQDTNSNSAQLGLPGLQNSLSKNKNIIIDTTQPTAPSRPIAISKTGITSLANGTMINAGNNNEITFSLSCTSGQITLYNDVQVLTTKNCTPGTTEIPVVLGQSAGIYYVTATVTNAAGTISRRSPAVTVIKQDSGTSATPGTPDLLSIYDLGASSTDNLTNVVQPVFMLSCASGATVHLYQATSLIGTAACIANTAQISPVQPLASGTYNLTAKQIINGTISPESSSLSITIETNPIPVTLARASTQSEPAISPTIEFVATFNSPVNPHSFDCNDVKTTNSQCVSITNTSKDKVFTITVLALSPGAVTISIDAKSIQAVSGNSNANSTGKDTIQYTPLSAAPQTPKNTKNTPQKIVHGQCSALKEFYTTKPSDKSLDKQRLCSTGSVVRVVYNAKQQSWSYTCRGENNGTNAVCSVQLVKALNSASEESTCQLKAGSELPFDKCTLKSKADMFHFQSYLSCLNLVTQQSSCKAAGCHLEAKRQELVYIASRIRGIPLGENYTCAKRFKDTTNGVGKWVCEVAEKARIAGLVSDKNTLFRPLDSLTRAEAYAIVLKSICINPEGTVKDWKTNVINTAKKYGFTNRTLSNFEPNRPISRGEIYALTVNAIEWKRANPDGCPTLPESLICDNI